MNDDDVVFLLEENKDKTLEANINHLGLHGNIIYLKCPPVVCWLPEGKDSKFKFYHIAAARSKMKPRFLLITNLQQTA